MYEIKTSSYTIPLSRWQKFLNWFRIRLGLLVRCETIVIHGEESKPFGLLEDNQQGK